MTNFPKVDKISKLFSYPAKPMKVFTHGFIDSIKPETGSNVTFFVNGEKTGQHYDMIMSCAVDGDWNKISLVWFPNPLAPDIQIHVSWGTRLVFCCN